MELYEAVVDTSLGASPRLAGVLQTTFAHATLRLDQFPTHEATSEVCPWQTAMQASILTVLTILGYTYLSTLHGKKPLRYSIPLSYPPKTT
jgi:hypothetical protein